jgi:hypothetical protein
MRTLSRLRFSRSSSTILFFCGLSVLLALSGCGGDGDGTGPDDEVNGLEFSMLANLLRSELSGLSNSLMLPGGAPGCMTVSSFADSDADGVPDSSDFVFSASGCLFSFEDGSGTTAGTVHVTDPGAAFGFSATLSGLSYTMTVNQPAETRVLTLNGQRQVTGSPSEIRLTQNVQVGATATGKPSASATEAWDAVFTPVQGSMVTFGVGVRLPDGSTVVSGPMTWVQSGNTVSMSLSTTVPIWFDPACESPFPSSGEVHAQVVSGGPDGYVKIRWSECGGEAETDWIAG